MVNYDRKPLDPSLYSPDPRLHKLYKKSTGIHDDAQLKAHILKIQQEAYDASLSFRRVRRILIAFPNRLSHTRISDFSRLQSTRSFYQLFATRRSLISCGQTLRYRMSSVQRSDQTRQKTPRSSTSRDWCWLLVVDCSVIPY